MGALTYILLSITILALCGLLLYLLSIKGKQPLHYIFLLTTVALLVWHVAVVLGGIYAGNAESFVFFDNFTYFGAAIIPVCLLMLGAAYGKNFKGFTWKYALLFIVPAITLLLIFTNDSHHLFYLSYTPEGGYVTGPYFYVYAAYSYILMLIGFVLLCVNAVRSSGVLSIQAVLVIVGSLIPAVVNVCYTLGVPGFGASSTPIAFAVTVLLYYLGMMKYDMFQVTPVALQTVIDQISDSFVVVDLSGNILDCNRPFRDQFGGGERKGRLADLAGEKLPEQDVQQILFHIEQAANTGRTVSGKLHIVSQRQESYYTAEYTPVYGRGVGCRAVIVLLKDVTQHMRDLKTIQDNQDILLERERLASLGQMIGGIAHNLKTPIMAVSGGIDQLKCLADEYAQSVGDKEVTVEDHLEIADEMKQWLSKMKGHMAYMSDIITTVKGQAAQLGSGEHAYFTISELMKRVKILMQHELVKGGCTLEVHGDQEGAVIGDMGSLIQVMNNIISNAIQSYPEGKGGPIEVEICEKDGKIHIRIADHGSGIPEDVQERLFREMITTKGKHGTGLGLYMSYSTIKGMFRGDLLFSSAPGKGTVFTIVLPGREAE